MDKPAPKKRGLKPKKKTNEVKPPPKKRGRKPKGGKIIKKSQIKNKFVVKHEQNVILHLKLFLFPHLYLGILSNQ